MYAMRGLAGFEKLSGFLHGDFTALELFENVFPAGRRGLIAEQDVHEVEALDDCGIGNPELFLDVANLALAAEEDHDEFLQIRRQTKDRRNWKGRVDGGVAMTATETADLELPFAERAAGDEFLDGLAAHVSGLID